MGFGAGSVGASGAPPTGAIIMFGGDDAPDGYRLCDGSAISRTTFANLFAEIGTNYGIGDGSTTFNIPDFRTSESFPRGAVNNAALGTEGGRSTFNMTEGELVPHVHRMQKFSVGSVNTYISDLAGTITPSGVNQPDTQSTGDGDLMDNKPPFVDVNFIIKT